MLRHAADRIMISVSSFVARTITNDAATSKTLDDHSHVVRPAEMEWKKTRFPGCEVKGLLLDQQTGLVTDAGDVPSAQQILRGNGRVTDISGADWDSIWGHVFED